METTVSTAVSDIPVADGSPVQGEVLSADLEKVGAALTEYSKVDAGLAQLRQTYGAVIYDVKTAAGMDAARKARLAGPSREAWEAHFQAVVAYETLRAKREKEVLVIETWRSLNANQRRGNL